MNKWAELAFSEERYRVKGGDKDLNDLARLVQEAVDNGISAPNHCFAEPQLLVICPDAFMAIDLFNGLKTSGVLRDKARDGAIVKGWKLFSKHMKPEAQAKTLEQNLSAKQRDNALINVYIGTSNRMLRMFEILNL